MLEEQLQQQRQIVRAIFEQGWNQADFAGVQALIAEQARFHIRGQTSPTNARDLERIVSVWHRAFPDFRFVIQDMLAQGDRVAVRLMLTGTHQEVWQNIPPTGRYIEVSTAMFLRFEDGKVAEIWEVYDEYGMRNQLGVK
jgi:steroid delta-isomerase-like uncharacterized protein